MFDFIKRTKKDNNILSVNNSFIVSKDGNLPIPYYDGNMDDFNDEIIKFLSYIDSFVSTSFYELFNYLSTGLSSHKLSVLMSYNLEDYIKENSMLDKNDYDSYNLFKIFKNRNSDSFILIESRGSLLRVLDAFNESAHNIFTPAFVDKNFQYYIDVKNIFLKMNFHQLLRLVLMSWVHDRSSSHINYTDLISLDDFFQYLLSASSVVMKSSIGGGEINNTLYESINKVFKDAVGLEEGVTGLFDEKIFWNRNGFVLENIKLIDSDEQDLEHNTLSFFKMFDALVDNSFSNYFTNVVLSNGGGKFAGIDCVNNKEWLYDTNIPQPLILVLFANFDLNDLDTIFRALVSYSFSYSYFKTLNGMGSYTSWVLVEYQKFIKGFIDVKKDNPLLPISWLLELFLMNNEEFSRSFKMQYF